MLITFPLDFLQPRGLVNKFLFHTNRIICYLIPSLYPRFRRQFIIIRFYFRSTCFNYFSCSSTLLLADPYYFRSFSQFYNFPLVRAIEGVSAAFNTCNFCVVKFGTSASEKWLPGCLSSFDCYYLSKNLIVRTCKSDLKSFSAIKTTSCYYWLIV